MGPINKTGLIIMSDIEFPYFIFVFLFREGRFLVKRYLWAHDSDGDPAQPGKTEV